MTIRSRDVTPARWDEFKPLTPEAKRIFDEAMPGHQVGRIEYTPTQFAAASTVGLPNYDFLCNATPAGSEPPEWQAQVLVSCVPPEKPYVKRIIPRP